MPETPSPAPSAPVPTPTPWHGRWIGRGIFAAAMLLLLKEAQPLLLPIVIAIILTFVLAPPVRALRRRGIPEVIGAGILVTALLGSATLVGIALAGPAADWLERAPATLEQLIERFDRLRATIPLLAPPAAASAPQPAPPPPQSARGRRAPVPEPAASAPPPPPPADPLKEKIASEGYELTGAVLRRSVSFTISTAAVVILLYFLLASEHWMLSRTVEAIPRRRARALFLAGVRGAQREIGQYLFALTLVNIGVGIIVTLAMMWLGLPSPALLGALAGALNFIPYIGPLLMAALLLLAGIVSFQELGQVVAPAAAFIAIHAVESNLVSPMFVAKRLTLSPVAVFVSVLFWGWLWGLAGAVIAVPLLVGMRSVCKRNRRLRLLCVYLEGGHKEPPSLRSLLRIRPRAKRPVAPRN